MQTDAGPSSASGGTQTDAGPSSASGGTQTDAMASSASGMQTDAMVSSTSGTQTDRRRFVTQQAVAASMEPAKKKPLVYQRDVAAHMLPRGVTNAYTQSVQAIAMDEDDASTVNYGDMDDAATVNYADDEMPQMPPQLKRAISQEREEEKKRLRTGPQSKVKLEGIKQYTSQPKPVAPPTAATRTAARTARASTMAPPGDDEDDDVAITGESINRSTDIAFWREQSARELRSQLNMRDRDKIGDWAFKSRAQLLELIQDMISKGTW